MAEMIEEGGGKKLCGYETMPPGINGDIINKKTNVGEVHFRSVPRWQNVFRDIFRFICVAAALTAVLVSLLSAYFPERTTPTDYKLPTLDDGNIPASAGTDTDRTGDDCRERVPEIIDEAGVGNSIPDYPEEKYTLERLVTSGNGAKVLILHTHTSEMCSENQTVRELGEILSEQLDGAGIRNNHCTMEFDGEGTVGAYARMNGYVSEFLAEEKETVCVIDLHSGDTDYPLTLTVSCGSNGWEENFSLARAICGQIPDSFSVIRLVPGKLGQFSGPLYLHVGIGSEGLNDADARQILYTFLSAFVGICSK